MSNTKEQIEILVELQKIEVERVQVQHRLEKDPERLRELDDQLGNHGAGLKEQEDRLSDLQKQYRTLDADLQLNGERVRKLQERLRSVKTNREYQATLKEIDDLKTKISGIEDRMIEQLDQIESTDRTVRENRDALRRFTVDTEEEKAAVETEIAENRARLAVLEEQREQKAAGLDPKLMKTYQRIRARGVAVAIAPVVGAVCQGCNMNIPPQMFNELQRFDSLKMCPFCERILYWKETPFGKQDPEGGQGAE